MLSIALRVISAGILTSSPSIVQPTLNSQTALQVKEYLDCNLENVVFMQNVCGIAFKSESQITRIFKKQFGLTLYEYLMDKRINAAKLYLLTSEMSIQKIAQRLQYTDGQHFASTFKSTLGKPQHNIVVRFGKR